MDPAQADQEPIFEDPNDEPDTPPDDDTDPVDFRRCARCQLPMAPRPGRTTHTHCATTTAA